MTAREIGKGLSRMSRQGRRTVASRAAGKRKKETVGRAEKRRLGQLVVCAVIFVSIVAARLLLPARMEQLSSTIRGTLGQSMDVQEVFSAVGRAVSGEESLSDSMDDVYQAVFGTAEGEAVETTARTEVSVPAETRPRRTTTKGKIAPPGTAADSGGETVPEKGLADTAGSGDSATPAEGAPDTTQVKSAGEGGAISAVTLVYSNLPKNVCMEQQILGFSYTSPVVGALSSPFGYREHPIEGEEKFHYGVDLAVNEGTVIGSFADGTVTAVGESSSLGKYIIVEHGNGYSTLYAHCSKVVVSSGTSVTRGQKIAEAGQTGMATGPHCHFELHRDSNYLNPIYYVKTA